MVSIFACFHLSAWIRRIEHIAAILVTCVAAVCGRAWAEGQVLKVGVIAPLTGEFAVAGEAFRRGIEIALEEHKTSGLQFIFEDEGLLDRARGVGAFHKFATLDKTAAVFGSVVNSATAYAALADSYGMPTLVLWDSNEKIRSLGEHVFGFGYSTELAGEDMAIFARQQLGISRIAVVSVEDEWSEIISVSFIKKFQALGGKVLGHEAVQVQTTDLRSVLLKFKRLNPEALYGPLFGPSLSSFVKQARQLKFGGQLLSGDGVLENDLKLMGEDAEGLYFAQIWWGLDAFSERYSQRFGQHSFRATVGLAALAYDAARLLMKVRADLVAQQRDITPNNVYHMLLQTDYQGLTGPVQFAKSRLSSKREMILRVRDSRVEIVPRGKIEHDSNSAR